VLDSILIMNLTQETDTMLYAPDTIILIDCFAIGTSIDQNLPNAKGFSISSNYPNPFQDQTHVDISIEHAGRLLLRVFDLMGREHTTFESALEAGKHTFNFYPGDENFYVFSATYMGLTKSIKVTNPESGYQECKITCNTYTQQVVKSKVHPLPYFHMHPDDELRFIGYSSIPMVFPIRGSCVQEHSPSSDSSYVFNIISGVPCIHTPFVFYDGVSYNTVKIGPQCWMKQNLNYGTMVPGTTEMTNNLLKEKYCYFDWPVNCEIYGGLYQWDEVMNYSDEPGAQGICPLGWHIPTDEEFKQLEGSVDSQYGYPDTIWDQPGYRGFDVGRRLKSPNNWQYENGDDTYGFSVFGTGCRFIDGTFMNISNYSSLWSSEETSPAFPIYRYLESLKTQVNRSSAPKNMGRSIRCLKNE